MSVPKLLLTEEQVKFVQKLCLLAGVKSFNESKKYFSDFYFTKALR